MDLRPLSDETLLARLEALAAQERENTADLIEHLAEADGREILTDRGYSTLFDYCVRKLRYSEAAAFLRIRAARASRDYPRILSDLRSGAIHLDAVMRLYPHLNAENKDKVLDEAAGASKQKVLALVARLGGADPAVERDVIRRVASKPPLPSIDFAAAPAGPEIIPPPSRIRLAFTADDEFLLLVERLKSLRRHKFPEGRLEDLLKEAVSALIAHLDPGQKGSRLRVASKGAKATGKGTRWIPARIKAAVWKRDGGRCAYVSADGTRCDSSRFLEYDHVIPWALGGRSDDENNIRLLCRPHNQRLARKRFGPRRRSKPPP